MAAVIVVGGVLLDGGYVLRHGLYVIDGDTFRTWDGERVRILDIDAPEMGGRAECDREEQLADEARARLTQLLREAPTMTLQPGPMDRDRYGRLLRTVQTPDGDVGVILQREGLAQPWRGRKANWCRPV